MMLSRIVPATTRSLSWVLLTVALLVASLTAPAAIAQSQTTTGTIEGMVTDHNGRALSGVTITMKNTANDFQRVLISDALGRFRGTLMPLGPSRVSAELEGFKSWLRDGIQLTAERTVSLGIVMKVAAEENE